MQDAGPTHPTLELSLALYPEPWTLYPGGGGRLGGYNCRSE